MKRRWKIALGVVAAVLLAGGAGFAWMILQPPPPASLVDPAPEGRRIESDGLLGNYYPAAKPGRNPAILLLGGSEGGLGRDVRDLALLLQTEGYSTLHLAYHNAPGHPARLANVPLETFYRGLDWLKRQADVDPDRMAIVGYSKGAEAGLLVATRYPGLRAVVLGMPSSVVWDGMAAENYMIGSFSSSWSEHGKPVPHLAYKGYPDERGLLPVFVNGLKQLDRHPETVIPAEQFAGKLLLICGEKDIVWPSCPMADQIATRVRRDGRGIALLRYPDAGHGVMGAPFTSEKRLDKWSKLGGTRAGNAAARRDSWRAVSDFLREHVGSNEDGVPKS